MHTANGDWSPQEDAELRGMVEQGGEGQWSVKAQAFSTNRSAGSLRHRWIRLQEQRQRQGPEQHQHQQHQEQEEEEEEEGVVLDVHATAGGTLDLALDCPLCRNSIEHAAVDLDGSLACYECMEAFVTHSRTTLRGNPMAAHQIRCACPPVSCFAVARERGTECLPGAGRCGRQPPPPRAPRALPGHRPSTARCDGARLGCWKMARHAGTWR